MRLSNKPGTVRSGSTRRIRSCLDSSCRVLDPACGDGAFLLAVFDELASRRFPPARQLSAGQRLALVRDQIFGVDIDPPAVAALRSELLTRIDPPDELAAEAAATLEQNIRCGDSLMGPDFSRLPRQPLDLWTDGGNEMPDAVSWSDAFPAAANAGGFDVVLGNPPYLRERNAKALFDKLAASEIGQRWRDARMDLWYYFLHRSLDLLRPGGVLAFIVNSYWMSSHGAGRLIDRLERETEFEEIQLLNDAPVFKSVAGRHMIFRLRKRDSTGRQRAPKAEAGPSVAHPCLKSCRLSIDSGRRIAIHSHTKICSRAAASSSRRPMPISVCSTAMQR